MFRIHYSWKITIKMIWPGCRNSFLFIPLLFAAFHAVSAQSLLSQGEWLKFEVEANGIYKLDFSFLNSLGLDPNGVDPAKIKIYGNGSGMLPQPNSAPRPTTLVENAIWIEGAADGSFDNGDYILFYGQGPASYAYEPDKGVFSYQKHYYSNRTAYFLTVSTENGLRIEQQENVGSNFPLIRDFQDFGYYELDQRNLLISGREWYGERFDLNTTQEFPFKVEGLSENSDVYLVADLMAQSYAISSFKTSLNGTLLGEQSFPGLSRWTYALKGAHNTDTFKINTAVAGSNGELNVTLTYERNNSGLSTGYLNYLLLTVTRGLSLYGDQTEFRSGKSLANGFSTYEVSNAIPAVRIWDVTDPFLPKNQSFELNGATATFGTASDELKTFVVFAPGNELLTPEAIGKIPNQDIRSMNVPDLLIITHPDFKPEAQRLASLRSSHDGLEVAVITTEEVYNEFSGGVQDVTAIRDFTKFLYDKGDRKKLKHLLLFGKSSYDFKDFKENNTNFVPTYQSRNSLHPLLTYSSDDYFAFLEEDEGEWRESFTGDHTLDIGVGRLPVKSPDEARQVVDKLVHYATSNRALGEWRNRVYMVADDGDRNIHINQADQLSGFIDTTYSQFNIQKIFLDYYPQISRPGGEIAPRAKEAIDDAIDKGTLIMNYTGHGGEAGWTQESILDIFMIDDWDNMDAMPLFVTATCEFGRHDDPGRISAGELTILNPKGGAIALVTTARPVEANLNFELNKAFYDVVFRQEEGIYQTLGDIFRQTKNNSLVGVNNRNFSLLGDPSMTLAFPREKIVVTAINGKELQQVPDTVKALSRVTLQGEVQNYLDQPLTSFNGIVSVAFFDKETTKTTLGSGTDSRPFSFKEREHFLFRGAATVTNGTFEVSFVVPKSISYLIDEGKVSMYAVDQGGRDASGALTNVLVGSSVDNAPEDNDPPSIRLFMGDSTFVPGTRVSPNTLLVARLSDENGINISGFNPLNSIVATLDGEVSYELNQYYSADVDNFRKGWVQFPLNDLEEGEHVITVRASDTYNNSSEASIEFYVTERSQLVIDKLQNYPNPVVNQTAISFTHNRSGDDLEGNLQIIDRNGGMVNSFDFFIPDSKATVELINWDGTDKNGAKVNRGLYIFKVVVRSLSDGAQNQKYQKLVLIN